MGAASPLRCVVVGEGSLPIVCGGMLMDRGHEIVALASPDDGVVRWGRSNGIRRAGTPSILEALAGRMPFDYLFSIVNFSKVPDVLLRAARRMAINYHDSPLPRYAGMHATSWALLNRESRHAVTWHVMERRMDAGAIVKQVPVDIDPGDTALTLNLKCYEAAVEGFAALLDDLEAGAVHQHAQDRQARSFFRRHQRPAAGCTLSFAAPAEELDALVRALDFGPYPNPLGLAKVALGEEFAIVTGLEVLEGSSGAAPGTLLAANAGLLVVGTATNDVVLDALTTIDGAPLDIDAVIAGGALRSGRIPAPDPARSGRLNHLCAEVAPFEAFWIRQLERARPTLATGAPPAPALAVDTRRVQLAGAGEAGGRDAVDRAIAAALASLARVTGCDVAVAYRDAALLAEVGDLAGFFSTCLPLCVPWRPRETAAHFATRVAAILERVRAHRTYGRDVVARMPILRARAATSNTAHWPVAISVGLCASSTTPLPRGRVLELAFDACGTSCTLRFDPSSIDARIIDAIADGLALIPREPKALHGPELVRLA